MPVHRRVIPSIKFAGTHLYTWVERAIVRVKCLAQEHNTMSPARARTRTARSGDERTNHEATAPPTWKATMGDKSLRTINKMCFSFSRFPPPPKQCFSLCKPVHFSMSSKRFFIPTLFGRGREGHSRYRRVSRSAYYDTSDYLIR